MSLLGQRAALLHVSALELHHLPSMDTMGRCKQR